MIATQSTHHSIPATDLHSPCHQPMFPDTRLIEAPSPTPARQEEGSRGDDGADDEQAFDDAVARMYAEQRARNTQIVGFVRKIPDGWVLVPREPTEAMLDAAVKGSAADVSYADVEELWPAMLSAAPHPSQEKGGAV